MKTCERCMRAIKPGEAYTSHDKLSTSAGGMTIYIHKECPPPE